VLIDMLNIVGDINFADGFFDHGFGVGSSIKKYNDPFCKIERKNDDIWIGNFECVASSRSDRRGEYAEQFRIDPKYLKQIQHLNYYNLANNHTMQHGSAAIRDTTDFISSVGSRYFGMNDCISTSLVYKGKSISITSFSMRIDYYRNIPQYWCLPSIKDIEKEYNNVSKNDFKILYLHWGVEFVNYPYIEQIIFAHHLIDMGFDLIIGAHPHILQGYEVYKGKRIFYSIGNFVFNMPWEATKYGLIVTLEYSGDEFYVDYKNTYIENDYFPTIISSRNIAERYSFPYLNSLIGLKQNDEDYFKSALSYLRQYRLSNIKYILSNIYRYSLNSLSFLLIDYVERLIGANKVEK